MKKRHGSYRVPDPPEPGWQSLANQIIALSFADLRLALRAKGRKAEERQEECLSFLLSDYVADLTDLNLTSTVKRFLEEEALAPRYDR